MKVSRYEAYVPKNSEALNKREDRLAGFRFSNETSCVPCVSSIPDVAAEQSWGCCCPVVWGLACRGCRCLDRLSPLSSCSRKKVDLDLTANTLLLSASSRAAKHKQCPVHPRPRGLPVQPPLCEDSRNSCRVLQGVPATQLVCEDRQHVTISCDCCYRYNPMLLRGPQGRARGGAGGLSPQQQ